MSYPSEEVHRVRLDYHEERMDELKESVDRLNETMTGMHKTFYNAQVCEKRVEAIEAEHRALMKLVASHQELVDMAKKLARGITSKTAKSIYLAVGSYVVLTRPELNGVWSAVKVLLVVP